MPSLAVGEASSGTNPVLDLYTSIGNPAVLTNILLLKFRIFDISTPAKKGAPVQVYPATVGDYQILDPTTDYPTGNRLSVGHYFAPWTVPLDSAIGDHKIEWVFQLDPLSPQETRTEEFFVMQTNTLVAQPTYCSVADIRAEGFTDTAAYPDSRIEMLINLASRLVDRWTGRWFYPLTFDSNNPMILDGRGSRSLHLHIPIIELTKLEIENQGLVNSSLTDIDLQHVRIYNNHIRGQLYPDDRENPRIAFIQTRIPETVTTGLFPAPRIFPKGRQNIYLQGQFGYTDPDGSPSGVTPQAIRFATCLLVVRELRLEIDACEKLNDRNRWRILSDKEGSTTVRLQELFLRGVFTGDPQIDNIIMLYKRPPSVAAI